MVALLPLARPDIPAMRRAGRAAARTLEGALGLVRPGISTAAIDRFVELDTRARGGTCAQKGHRVGRLRFPAHVCTSRNDVVCHGIPSPDDVLRDGDILNVDVTTGLGGFHGDTSRTVLIGAGGPEARHVVAVAERALQLGIEAVRPGAPLHDIGRAIEAFVVSQGCSVVRDYGGHGIGSRMHLPPHVPHYARRDDGPRMVEGACFTIEPMVNLGGPALAHDDDGWTVRTADGSLSARFEHTILVTADGAEVLTR